MKDRYFQNSVTGEFTLVSNLPVAEIKTCLSNGVYLLDSTDGTEKEILDRLEIELFARKILEEEKEMGIEEY